MRYILEDCSIDSSSVVRLSSDQNNIDKNISADHEAFSLLLTIAGNHTESFELLWHDYGYFWNEAHLLSCLKTMKNSDQKEKQTKFIKLLLNSKTSSDIFNFLNIDAKVDFVSKIDELDKTVKPKCLKYIKKKPYRWAYIVYKAQDADKLDSK